MPDIYADMAANVWKVVVTDGAPIEVGDTLVILESMKMEIPIESTGSGIVRLHVAEGDSVQERDLIASIEVE